MRGGAQIRSAMAGKISLVRFYLDGRVMHAKAVADDTLAARKHLVVVESCVRRYREMRCQGALAGRQGPHMQVVDGNYAGDLEQRCLDVFWLNTAGRAFHQDSKRVADEVVCRVQYKKREDEGADGINNRKRRLENEDNG